MNGKELKEILEQHKLWLDTRGKEGRRADLRFAKFKRCDLTNVSFFCANLSGADLRYAILRNVNFCGANLSLAYFYGSTIEGANFKDAYIDGASFHGIEGLPVNLNT